MTDSWTEDDDLALERFGETTEARLVAAKHRMVRTWVNMYEAFKRGWRRGLDR